jgi:predicted nuclease of predicted toxin-antitoxin system
MKFLCDVHISYKIVRHLINLGFEAIHINDILNKSETKDSDICVYADQNDYVVITKDSDFRNSFLVKQLPKKLIKINLGNISNVALQNIFSNNIKYIAGLSNMKYFMVEIDPDNINLIEI